jgi:hypothetical protein
VSRRRRRTVFGEPVEVLTGVIRRAFRDGTVDAGCGVAVSGRVEDELLAWARASLRAEAVVLRREADRLRDWHEPELTADARLEAATGLVVLRWAEVVRSASGRAAGG